MAIVKTLIVKGVARFLTDAYMSTIKSGIWNGSTIQVGYGGTGVTSAKGDLYTPVFLSSSGIAACSVEIPHATKDFKINGKTYAVFTNSTESAPTIYAPTTLASTGGYILATNSAKTGLEWVAKPAANVTTSAVVASSATGTTLITADQSDPYYNLLEGGAVARSIQFKHGSNMTISSTAGGVITFTATNTWRNIYTDGTSRVGTGTGTKAMNFAVAGNLSVSYLAAGTNTGQSGSADYFTIKITANANAVGVAGYVAAPTKASNPNLVWMTNSDGVPAWRNAIASAVLANASNSTTQLTAEQANPFYNLLFGGSVARSVQFVAGPGMLVGTTDGSNIRITNNAPIYYVVGNDSDTAGVWTGTCSEISEYYNGLTIMYVPKVAGASSTNPGTTLKLNNLAAINCYTNNTSKLTTHYAANTPILFTYYEGFWRRADYDSNSNTWRGIRVNNSGSDNVGTGTGTKSMNFTSSNLTISYLAAGTGTGQSGNANYFTINLEAKNWSGATSSAAGTAGYMPGAAVADRTKFLRGDGSWVALSLTDHTHSVKINGSTKTIAAPGGTAVDLGNYLPLTGNSTSTPMTGTIYSKDVNALYIYSSNKDIDIWHVDGNSTAWDNHYGFYLRYLGINSGNDNDLVLYAHNQVSTPVEVYRVHLNGLFIFKYDPYVNSNVIAHAGNISNKAATIGTSLTTIATIAGVDITAKIDLSSIAMSANATKTLNVDSWTDVSGFTGVGTYAIQISCGDLYASGILSGCGGSDTVIDEVPLHVTNKGTNTWRPYARVNGSKIQMTTNEASPGTERTYTIKILKLI